MSHITVTVQLPLAIDQIEWLAKQGFVRCPNATEYEPDPTKLRGKHYVRTAGYAMPPGTGPKDKECKDCCHCHATHGNRNTFYKCGLCRANWTNGRRTDILFNAPACSRFQGRPS
jgi:hypothetical protein